MKLCIIRHVAYERFGHLPRVLDELGLSYHSISLAQGDPLPPLEEVGGLITLGGPMSAYETSNHPWIVREEHFLKELHARHTPVLGICLGAQILAQAFGARVFKAPQVEVGWVALTRTASLDDFLLKDIPLPLLFQFHYDVFDLPSGAVNLLKSQQTPHQMFRLSPTTYGVQFHPEASEEMVRSVFEQYKDDLSLQAQQDILHELSARSEDGYVFLRTLMKRLFLPHQPL